MSLPNNKSKTSHIEINNTIYYTQVILNLLK